MTWLRQFGWAIFIAVLLGFAALPFYWMLMTSLKPGDDQLIRGNPWWTNTPTIVNYVDLFHSEMFGHWIVNTAVVTVGTLLISVTSSLLAGYALASFGMRFSRSIVLVLFATYLLPQGVLFLPLVRMLSRLHLTDTPLALIVTYPSLVIPFGTWILWSFFRELPRELLDQARIEGAGGIQALWRVLLPLSWPVLAAVGLFAVAVVFSDFLYAFALVSRPENMTLMAGVGSTSVDIDDPGLFFAAILLGMAPVALFCAFSADTYARGLGTGVIEPS